MPAATEPMKVQAPHVDDIGEQDAAGTQIEKDDGELQPNAPGIQGPLSGAVDGTEPAGLDWTTPDVTDADDIVITDSVEA